MEIFLESSKTADKSDFDHAVTFDYVLKPSVQSRLCFGSTLDKKLAFENKIGTNPRIGPNTYDTNKAYATTISLNKPRSLEGMPPLASKAKRFAEVVEDDTPAPNKYLVKRSSRIKKLKKNWAPFGRNEKIIRFGTDSNPGVGNYDLSGKRCRRIKVQYNFGRPKVTPAVEVLCRPFDCDMCHRCSKTIDTDIEYWHMNYKTYLCTPCLFDEKHSHEMCTLKQLREFKKVRNCHFKHEHGGTTATVQTISDQSIRKKFELENYLSLYLRIGNEKHHGAANIKYNYV